jgi:hypothetical protein
MSASVRFRQFYHSDCPYPTAWKCGHKLAAHGGLLDKHNPNYFQITLPGSIVPLHLRTNGEKFEWKISKNIVLPVIFLFSQQQPGERVDQGEEYWRGGQDQEQRYRQGKSQWSGSGSYGTGKFLSLLGFGSGSFHHQAKIVLKENPRFLLFWFPNDVYFALS